METRVDTGGAAIFAKVDPGPMRSPWITFSNSHATDHTLWDQQVELLSRHYNVLRYDTRGHGRSTATSVDYSFELLIADLFALWDALQIDKTAIVGLSLGGTTSLEAAARAPDRVTAVFAADCRHYATPEFSASWEPRIKLAETSGMDALIPSTMERWFTEATRRRMPPELDKIRQMIRETSVDGYIGCARALQSIKVDARLSEIRCPVKIVSGRSDQAAPPDLIADMAAKIAGATSVIIEDAAHITNVERPDVFNRELENFLTAISV